MASGAKVTIGSVPAGSLRQPVRFRFRVDYRDVPEGSGLLELAFEGFAVTAPADRAAAHTAPPGEYRLRARISDSRKDPRSMIDQRGRELASARSGPFTIEAGGPVRTGSWRPEK